MLHVHLHKCYVKEVCKCFSPLGIVGGKAEDGELGVSVVTHVEAEMCL